MAQFDTASECPDCHGPNVMVTAVVSCGCLERSFYECMQCGQVFTGSWSNPWDERRSEPAPAVNAAA